MNCLCCVFSLVLRVPLAKRSGVNETKPKEKKIQLLTLPNIILLYTISIHG